MGVEGIIGRPETIVELFPGDLMGRLVRGVTEAVHKSFCDKQGKMSREITQAEIRERFNACMKWAKTLRGDLKWGIERIVGQFDEILICHLAKKDYVPPQRQCWVASDGN